MAPLHAATAARSVSHRSLGVLAVASLPAETQADETCAAQLREALERTDLAPAAMGVRLLHPRGTVELWLVLDRSGALQGSGVSTSSNHALLDQAALSAVRQARFPSFAETVFPGRTQAFRVSFCYPAGG
jgi:protein TonB